MSNTHYAEENGFGTKSAARNYVKGLGYTELVDTTSSGDYAHGSREYYGKPEDSGVDHKYRDEVSISKVAGRWYPSFFPKSK